MHSIVAIRQVRTLSRRFERWLESSLLHRAIIVSLSIVIMMRLWFAIWGVAIIQASGSGWEPNKLVAHSRYTSDPEGVGRLFSPWQRWDAQYYLRIADDGYSSDDATPSFFPLFPVLMRLVAAVTGQNSLFGSLVVCTIATFWALVFLYLLAADLIDETTARYSVIYWVIFPTGYYLFGGYAEPILVACALSSLYFARQQRWWLAGVFAIGATLARPVGFLIVVPLVIEGWLAGQSLRKRLTILIPMAGAIVIAMGTWMLYLHIAFNDALLWVHAEEATWHRVFVILGQTVFWTIQNIAVGRGPTMTNVIDLILTCIVAVALVMAWRKLPLSFAVYGVLMVLVPLLNYAQGVFTLMPMAAAGRRALVIFPAFIGLASAWRGRWRTPLWIWGSAGLQLILFILFVQWVWVD